MIEFSPNDLTLGLNQAHDNECTFKHLNVWSVNTELYMMI